MGKVLKFHGRASVKPNTEGSAFLPRERKASTKTKKCSAGMRPRDFQLEMADRYLTPATSQAADDPPTALTTSSTDLSMAHVYSRSMNMSSLHEKGMENCSEHGTIQKMPISKKDVSRRLRDTINAMGMSQAEICRETGLKPNQLNQFLNPNSNRITPDAIEILYRHYGISADWLYFGNSLGLPHSIRSKLPAAAA